MTARSMRSRAVFPLFALAVAACGGTTAPRVGTGTAGAERPPYVACENPSEVRLAPHVCWNPAGSRWHVTAQAPGGELSFDVELMAGGRVRSTDTLTSNPATDEWFVQEDILRIFLANRFVEYRGQLSNGSLLVGDAINVRGDAWEFRAERQHGGSCASNELTVTAEGADPVCYSAAGARWTVSARGASFVVDLGAGGALTSSNPSDTTVGNDTWTQAGNEVRLRFDEGASEYTVTLDVASLARGTLRVEGAGRDGSGPFDFTVQPVPSYPPPFH